jgi:RNA polymerase sigma factor (TIGR02999 family)
MDGVSFPDEQRAPGHCPPADRASMGDLFELVYGELRTLARRQIAHLNPGETLCPTALVHEVFVRLSDRAPSAVRSEQHFRALAARVMRQLIIDYIRNRTAQKRSAGVTHDEPMSDLAVATGPSNEELLAIDEALIKLATLDTRQAEIVELRFFGGLTIEEIATTTSLSERTVKREWLKARAFLYDALHSG